MKFDVVVGNPPYQDSNKAKKKLWVKFVDVFLDDRLKFMGFVTPTSWAYGDKREVVNIRNKMAPYLSHVDLSASRHFPNVGEDISAWIYQRTESRKESGLAEVIDKDGNTVRYRFTERYVSAGNKKFLGIYDKVMTERKSPSTLLLIDNGDNVVKKSGLSSVSSKEYMYEIFYSASKRMYSKTKLPEHDKWKVIINRSGYYYNKKCPEKYIVKTNNMSSGRLAVATLCKDEKECDNLITILHSRLFIFLMEHNDTMNTAFKDDVFRLPKMDITHAWTDQQLYQHFSLTQQEIDHIEETVK